MIVRSTAVPDDNVAPCQTGQTCERERDVREKIVSIHDLQRTESGTCINRMASSTASAVSRSRIDMFVPSTRTPSAQGSPSQGVDPGPVRRMASVLGERRGRHSPIVDDQIPGCRIGNLARAACHPDVKCQL